MLTREDNELITNTDPGTPMGELFRRFWTPVALASELPGPDCEPVRIRVMSEDLIAFRDSEGRVAVIDAYCPHRGAPLFFGRNEESGLRCIYHGWKFDVDGKCVDVPNAPEGPAFKDKIRIVYYPSVEAGNLIWAYMGPPEKEPPFPKFEWCNLPATHVHVTRRLGENNYLQSTEGGIDQSHARFLHSNLDGRGLGRAGAALDPNEPFPRAVGGRRVTDGTRYGALGNVSREWISESDAAWFRISVADEADGRTKANINAVRLFPFYINAGVARPGHHHVNVMVPVDNHHAFLYRVNWSDEALSSQDIHEYEHDERYNPPLLAGSTTPRDNIHNDYNIDRTSQRMFRYSGMKNPGTEDQAMTENQWGPVANRWKEHLTSTDDRIIYLRRRLLKAARALADGVEPSEPWHPEAFGFHDVTVEAENEEAAVAEALRRAVAPRTAGQMVAPTITV